MGYSFTDKLIKRNYEGNSCIIEIIQQNKSVINVRLICQVDQLIDNTDLPKT